MIEHEDTVIPSDPESRKKIAAVFKDMSNQLLKAEVAKEYVKEAKKSIKEEYNIPLSVINKLFNLYHSKNAIDYFDGQRELEIVFGILFPEEVED